MVKRILVSEDNDQVRAVTVNWLEGADYEVRAAESGIGALRVLDMGYDPDLITTNERNDFMKGSVFVSELEKRGSTIPVLFFSSLFDEVEVKYSGKLEHLKKPYSFGKLIRKVEDMIGE